LQILSQNRIRVSPRPQKNSTDLGPRTDRSAVHTSLVQTQETEVMAGEWNKLPAHVLDAETVITFKNCL